MPKRFFISDLHFDHAKLCGPEGCRMFPTVKEMNECIVDRWNSAVNNDDKVFVVGDVALSTTPESLDALLGSLKGEKVLVMGNHDNAEDKIKVYQRHFIRCVGALEYKTAIVTHIPVHPRQLNRYKYNIHGHLHTSMVYDEHGWDMRYINVSCEQCDYTPKVFEEHLRCQTERNLKHLSPLNTSSPTSLS